MREGGKNNPNTDFVYLYVLLNSCWLLLRFGCVDDVNDRVVVVFDEQSVVYMYMR